MNFIFQLDSGTCYILPFILISSAEDEKGNDCGWMIMIGWFGIAGGVHFEKGGKS